MGCLSKVPWWVAVLALLAIFWLVGKVWGPFGFGARVFDRVIAYDSLSVQPAESEVHVVVEFEPVSDRRNALEDIVGLQPDFYSVLESELAGCVRAFVKDAGDTSATAAFVFRAADLVGADEAYLYGTFYYRRYRDRAEFGGGFGPVRVRVDSRRGSNCLVNRMEVRPADIRSGSTAGQRVEGPYPRWVDEAAFIGSDQDMQRLLGPG